MAGGKVRGSRRACRRHHEGCAAGRRISGSHRLLGSLGSAEVVLGRKANRHFRWRRNGGGWWANIRSFGCCEPCASGASARWLQYGRGACQGARSRSDSLPRRGAGANPGRVRVLARDCAAESVSHPDPLSLRFAAYRKLSSRIRSPVAYSPCTLENRFRSGLIEKPHMTGRSTLPSVSVFPVAKLRNWILVLGIGTP